MTDQGTADDVYVCGPNCKATKREVSWWAEANWGERIAVVIAWTAITAFATVGALDVGLRSALHYWHF